MLQPIFTGSYKKKSVSVSCRHTDLYYSRFADRGGDSGPRKENWVSSCFIAFDKKVLGLFFGVFLQYKLQEAQKCCKKHFFPLFRGSGGPK